MDKRFRMTYLARIYQRYRKARKALKTRILNELCKVCHYNRKYAIRKLSAVGLGPEVGELYPAELSGGMQKRVSLARAIAAEPEIIFFDEPTTGLDPIMGDVINDLIIACVRQLGATAMSITHDMASARKIADRIAMIYKGRIIWSGETAEIDRSGNDFVEQFIHGSAEGPIKMEVRAT